MDMDDGLSAEIGKETRVVLDELVFYHWHMWMYSERDVARLMYDCCLCSIRHYFGVDIPGPGDP